MSSDPLRGSSSPLIWVCGRFLVQGNTIYLDVITPQTLFCVCREQGDALNIAELLDKAHQKVQRNTTEQKHSWLQNLLAPFRHLAESFINAFHSE